MTDPPEPHHRDADRLIYAGLLGLGVAGLLQLIDKGASSEPLLVAAYCFALAMPLLAVGLITDYARRAGADLPRWRNAIGGLGAAAAVGGLGAMFLHVGVGVCVVFAASCALGLVLIRRL
jgi:hypothetical protein